MGRSLATVGATAVIVLLSGSAASADEGGNPCVANDSEAGLTAIGLTNPPNPFKVPFLWSGVITRWKVPVAPGHGPLAQQLGVFEQTFVEGETQYRKVAESATETVVEGTNEFATRIPLAGEGHHYLGLTGPVETLLCAGLEHAISGTVLGDFPLGATRPAEDRVDIGTPVTAIAEPDWDQDGYGDQTQDGCPYAATIQSECPTVTPSASAKARLDAIVLSVWTDSEGSVEVSGETSWKSQSKGGAGGKASKQVGGRFVVRLQATEKRTVPPGSVVTFRVPLPKSVKHHLGRIKPSRSLRARLTVTATDIAYRERSTALTVKLKGRGKPRRGR